MVATAMMQSSVPVHLALTFNYGQRAAMREITAAQKFCELWKIPHRVLELPWLGEESASALNKSKQPLPHLATTELDTITVTTQSAAAVWVPNRNGVFLNIAAAIAEANGVPWIVAGFNREEATTFPDNSPNYVEALNHALYYSTQGKVALISPTQAMVKKEIVAWASTHDVPLQKIWPCYEGGETWCRKCESCLRFLRASEA